MRRTAVALATAAAMSGCVSLNQQSLNADSVAGIKGQTVTYTARAKPDFAAMTAGKAMFAMIGAFAMISEGNRIVSENKIEDPASQIATGLANELGRTYEARLVVPPATVSADDAGQVAASVNGAARFAIDVQTTNWSFGYFPTDWTHYRVIYVAKARVIDVQSKAVVAEGFCKHVPESNAGAPTYEELIADQAARLKTELSTIANECVGSMKAHMLSL